MIVYPTTLPANGRAFNFVSSKAYNPQNDIVLSIEYCVSGNTNTEAGISFFIHQDTTLIGGTPGADLTYSGFDGSQTGIDGAVVGVGLDSTGVFGLSATGRDGLSEDDIIPNSIAVRSGMSEYYALSTHGNYYKALSSFTLIDNQPKTLRFRLGNVGRALFIDVKHNHDSCYELVAAIDIGDVLGVTDNSEDFYKIGVGFTTPVSANNTDAVANFYFKTVHVEGLASTLSSTRPLLEVWENILPIWTDVFETWSL